MAYDIGDIGEVSSFLQQLIEMFKQQMPLNYREAGSSGSIGQARAEASSQLGLGAINAAVAALPNFMDMMGFNIKNKLELAKGLSEIERMRGKKEASDIYGPSVLRPFAKGSAGYVESPNWKSFAETWGRPSWGELFEKEKTYAGWRGEAYRGRQRPELYRSETARGAGAQGQRGWFNRDFNDMLYRGISQGGWR